MKLREVVEVVTLIGVCFGAFFFFEARYVPQDQLEETKAEVQSLRNKLEELASQIEHQPEPTELIAATWLEEGETVRGPSGQIVLFAGSVSTVSVTVRLVVSGDEPSEITVGYREMPKRVEFVHLGEPCFLDVLELDATARRVALAINKKQLPHPAP